MACKSPVGSMKPPDPPCIAVVHTDIGANPTPDDADTLLQAQFISRCLQQCGHHAPLLPYRPETLKTDLDACKAMAVFNMVEAVGGEDGRAPEGAAFFENMGLPVSGNSSRTLTALINKPTVKRRLQQYNLPTPAFPEDGGQGKQWILKSETFHCSRGMDHRNVSGDLNSLNTLAGECARQYGGNWFLEEYIPGREINIALLDNGTALPDILPASEIHFTGREPHIVDYDSKWNENSESHAHTTPGMAFSDTDKPLLDKLGKLAQQCWQYFNLSGYARVDFRIDKAGNPFILEINANPCLSEDAGFMRAAQHAGLTATDVVMRLVPLFPAKRTHETRTA